MNASQRLFAALASIGLLAAVLTGCASTPRDGTGPDDEPSDGPGAAAGVVHVEMSDVAFSPAILTVAAGTTVTWTNRDPIGHTVTPADPATWGTAGSGDAEPDWLLQGGTWSHTFTAPGTYAYYCKPHAAKASEGSWRGMVGTVTVMAAGSDDDVTDDGPATDGDPLRPVPQRTVVPSPVAPPLMAPGADGIVHIVLETREVVAQLADGVGYTFWTFDGTVPGPMLRVREGDTVELTLRTAADSVHPHSIDLHAVTGPGGGATVTQTAPGGSNTFTFKALDPGLYVYHCATAHIPSHIANGMYGLILVEPAHGLPPVDREFYVMQGEFYTGGELGEPGVQPLSLDKLLDEDAEYYAFNGRVGALTGGGALTARVNETVRIYFGVGSFVPSSFHVIGEIFDNVYPEGGSPPVQDVQTTLVPGGGATMVEFALQVPGTYLLVDHWLTHAIDRGAAGHLIVTGPADPNAFAGTATGGSGH